MPQPETLPLFPSEEPSFREKLAAGLRRLANQQLYIGTSSWKYPGWLDQIYTRQRYSVRGRFSKKCFEDSCLEEYAETFPIVCGDFAFYQFPSREMWARLFNSTPAHFQFAFKVPDEITMRRWPVHPRSGDRAGTRNDNFLDAELFRSQFLELLLPYQQRVATLIFEFTAFSQADYKDLEPFLEDLNSFAEALPAGFRYPVEIRTPEFFHPRYFHFLKGRRLAHVFNAWSRSPALGDQLAMIDSITSEFLVCRALLRRGTTYEDAVKRFSPYKEVADANPEGRAAIRELLEEARHRRMPAYIFINNRFEGNAPSTIAALIDET